MSQNQEMRDAILLVIRAIPKGKVASYGQVAEMAGFPGRARLVGYILRKLPNDSRLPWHRVLNSQGKLSLDGPSAQEQQCRLENDGVSLYKGKVARSYFWQP